MPVEHHLRDLPIHRYGVELAPGDYARIRLSQKGADMSVALSSPSGQEILEFDSPSGIWTKWISVIAEVAGIYTFEIRPREVSEVAVGGYGIELTELRPATADDRLRIDAEHTAARAFLHLREARPENLKQALPLFGKALEIFRSLSDRHQEAIILYGIGMAHHIGKQPAKAAPAFEQSRELWRETGDLPHEGLALNQIGRVRDAQGDVSGALTAFQEGLPLAKATGDSDLECTLLYKIGTASCRERV